MARPMRRLVFVLAARTVPRGSIPCSLAELGGLGLVKVVYKGYVGTLLSAWSRALTNGLES